MRIKSEIKELGYRFLPDALNEKLFGDCTQVSALEKARAYVEFEKFGLVLETQENKEIGFPDLDKILGSGSPQDLLDKATKPYAETMNQIREFLGGTIPAVPPNSILRECLVNEGWSIIEGANVSPIDCPQEPTMVLDVETYVRAGNYPVMACAVTSKAWYVWLCPSLVNGGTFKPGLISVGEGKTIVNFNTLFDGNKIQESYRLIDKSVNLFDLMSCHIACNGASREQKYLIEKPDRAFDPSWLKHTTLKNSLVEAYNFHVCPDVRLGDDDKLIRNMFVYGDMDSFRSNALDLVRYNIFDCVYTFRLGSKLLPKYLYHNPTPVTWSGHLILGHTALPVVSDWDRWVDRVKIKHAEVELDLNFQLTKLAEDLYKNNTQDYWTKQLDWTPAKTGENRGVPAWYRKEIIAGKKKKGANPISTKSKITPLLLKIQWDGKPLFYHSKLKWCYKVERGSEGCFYDEENDQYLKKIPHPKGDKKNCGNPLAKDYIKFLDNGTLSSPDERAGKFMKDAKSLSYWSSMVSRVSEFYTYPAQDLPQVDMIKPYLIPHGTVTRRAVEPTFLTMSDIKPGIIGSELRSRIQAPKGYVLMGADFDAQELKYGAGLSDSYSGIHGSTAMSITQMLGSKETKTDGHSLLAQKVGIDRQTAKTMNFQMLFFCGTSGLFEAVKTARMDLDDSEALAIARKALKLRRGTKNRQTGRYEGGTDSKAYNYMVNNASSPENRTAFSKSAISRPLQKDLAGKDFMPSRCNRVIQSGCVDILHIFLTLLDYLIKRYEVDGYFLISVHDEIWTMVSEDDVGLMSEVFQTCHLLTWVLVYQSLGFSSIPFDYAFFSSINVDSVMRKEVDNATVWVDGKEVYSGTKSPSNPDEETPKGYDIKPRDMEWCNLG